MLSAGNAAVKGWTRMTASSWRFGYGYEAGQALVASGLAIAKWNFVGCRATVWLPRGPQYGSVQVLANGQPLATVDLYASSVQPAAPVVTWSSPSAAPAPAAVLLRAINGSAMPLDSLNFSPCLGSLWV